MKKMELFDHQKNFLAKNPAKSMLAWECGTGKTITGILWSEQKYATLHIVVCPKALKKNWERNLNEHSNGFNPWIILSKEEFKMQWKSLPFAETLLFDEGHYFSGMKSDMSKSLDAYARKWKVENILIMTATPYRSSAWDIYVAARHLGYEWNYYKFLDKFFHEVPVGRPVLKDDGTMKPARMVMKMKNGMEDEVARIVSRIGDIVKLEDCADVPEQTFETEVFSLTAKQIEQLEIVSDPNPAVRFTKKHQVENGVLKGDEYTPDQTFPCDKTERILELCQDNKKIIIVCRYKLQISMLRDALQPLGRKIYVISGDSTGIRRDEIVQEADAAQDAIVLIQAQCSEGYQLPSFPLMVFASMDFSYPHYKQICGRILRIDKLKKNVYLHLVTSGVDTAVYGAIIKKQSFDTAIYERNEKKRVDREGLSDPLHALA